MAQEFNWSSVEKGHVLSAFYYGYLMQFLGGWAAGKWGGKRVLAAAVGTWSVFTALTPTVSRTGHINVLMAARVAVGVAEGVNYPSQAALAAHWIPRSELARAWSIASTGESMGTILALLAGPWLATHLGWPSLFYATAAPGAVWLACFIPLASATPEAHHSIGAQELRFIQASRPDATLPKRVPWLRFVTTPAYLALILVHMSYNTAYYIALSWMPTFFENSLHVKFADLGVPSLMPYLTLWVLATVGGVLGDWLLTRGLSTAAAQKTCNTIGMLGPAAALMALTTAHSVWEATLWLSLAVGLGGFAMAGYWSNFITIGGRYSSHVTGLSNSIATIPGIVGNVVTGWLLHKFHGDFNPVFALVAGIQAFGAILFLLTSRGTTLFEDADAPSVKR